MKLTCLDSSIMPGLGLSTHQHPLMAHYCPQASTCSRIASSTSTFMVMAAVIKSLNCHVKLTRLDSSITPGLAPSTHQHPLMARYCPPASTRSETASSTSMFMVMAAVNKRSLNSHVKLIRLDSSITPGLGLSTHQHPLMAHYCPTAPTCTKTASSTSMFMFIAAVNKKASISM